MDAEVQKRRILRRRAGKVRMTTRLRVGCSWRPRRLGLQRYRDTAALVLVDDLLGDSHEFRAALELPLRVVLALLGREGAQKCNDALHASEIARDLWMFRILQDIGKEHEECQDGIQ